MDNKKFLVYEKNEKFIYFWNISKCVYPLVVQLCRIKRFSNNVLRGFIFSINSKTEEISKESLNAMKDFLQANPDCQHLILENIYKIFNKNKKKEKFFEASLNCLSMLLKFELSDFSDEKIFESVLWETYEVCKKSTSINRLKIGSQIVPFLLEKVNLQMENFPKYREIIELFMFSDYPLVRKEFFENFYLFLISAGSLLFQDEDVEELTEIISNIDISEQGEQYYYLFKTRWEEIVKGL